MPFGWPSSIALLRPALRRPPAGLVLAQLGLPSLVVTLAGLIGWRGAARILVEDRSIGDFPDWFDRLGQDDLLGPLPFAIAARSSCCSRSAAVVLHRTAVGRCVYVIGDNAEVARYSGINVDADQARAVRRCRRSSPALAGILFAARLGTVRGDLADGFELEIITIVLLGGRQHLRRLGPHVRRGARRSSSCSTCATASASPTSTATPRPA